MGLELGDVCSYFIVRVDDESTKRHGASLVAQLDRDAADHQRLFELDYVARVRELHIALHAVDRVGLEWSPHILIAPYAGIRLKEIEEVLACLGAGSRHFLGVPFEWSLQAHRLLALSERIRPQYLVKGRVDLQVLMRVHDLRDSLNITHENEDNLSDEGNEVVVLVSSQAHPGQKSHQLGTIAALV